MGNTALDPTNITNYSKTNLWICLINDNSKNSERPSLRLCPLLPRLYYVMYTFHVGNNINNNMHNNNNNINNNNSSSNNNSSVFVIVATLTTGISVKRKKCFANNFLLIQSTPSHISQFFLMLKLDAEIAF